MEKTNNTQSKLPNKCKFFRRTLELGENSSQVLAKTRLKKLYFKEIVEQDFEETSKYYAKRKDLRYVKNLQLEVMKKQHFLNVIKNCRNLKDLNLEITFDMPFPHIITLLKRLPKHIEVIDIFGVEINIKPALTGRLYRNLAVYRNLRTLWRSVDYADGKRCIEKEYGYINKYLPRLKNLSEFCYEQTESSQIGFQRIMKQNVPCPLITDLSLQLAAETFENFTAVEQFLEEENSDEDTGEAKKKKRIAEDEDEDWTDSGDEEEKVRNENRPEEDRSLTIDGSSNEEGEDDDQGDEDGQPNQVVYATEEERIQAVNNEMAPFFRFHLFQNLQKLRIIVIEGCLYPVNSSVVEGFKCLNKLEQLSIVLESRPVGTRHFFEGLIHLPLLVRFSLEITFIKNNEYELLGQFLSKQTQLESLSLSILTSRRTVNGYKIQNFCLENAWHFLDNKPKLRNLSLKSSHWPIESLSKGLEKAGLVNQLKDLEIEVFDDYVTSLSSPSEKVQGFCDFLVKQKNSLRTLKMFLSFVEDDMIVDRILRAASELEGLNVFLFRVNTGGRYSQQGYNRFFKKVFSKKLSEETQKGVPKYQNTFLQLEDTLKKLQKLVEFNVELNPLIRSKDEAYVDSSVVLNALPEMKALKVMYLRIPYLKEALKNNPNQVLKLLELQSATKVDVKASGNDKIKRLSKIVKQVNLKQSLRTDLMF